MDETSASAELRQVTTTDSRELDRVCERIAQNLFDADTEPTFNVTSANFASDPFLICADRYWRLRFLAVPTVSTAMNCARWLHLRVDPAVRVEVFEKWALGYAFITRDSVESREELADATARIVEQTPASTDLIAFAALYHAGKLRANFCFDELRQFLESSLLAFSVGPRLDEPLFLALQAFAAFGSTSTTSEHAISLLDRAWSSPVRTRHVTDVCLNALSAAQPFPGQGELLRDKASEAVALYPVDHLFHFRHATGQRLTNHHDGALHSIDQALRFLPATGTRGSHKLLQEQYLRERDMIIEGMQRSAWAAEQHRHRLASESALEELRTTAQNATVRAIELVTVFTAAIAFAVGSLQVTLNGTLSVRDRIWILLAFGIALNLFALLTIGGTWYITRKRR